MHQEKDMAAAATMQIEQASDQSQLRQVKNTMYKSQRQVEKAMVLLGYKGV
jgi:hypothetical protein